MKFGHQWNEAPQSSSHNLQTNDTCNGVQGRGRQGRHDVRSFYLVCIVCLQNAKDDKDDSWQWQSQFGFFQRLNRIGVLTATRNPSSCKSEEALCERKRRKPGFNRKVQTRQAARYVKNCNEQQEFDPSWSFQVRTPKKQTCGSHGNVQNASTVCRISKRARVLCRNIFVQRQIGQMCLVSIASPHSRLRRSYKTIQNHRAILDDCIRAISIMDNCGNICTN